jgi:hypothetical protein
MTPTAECPAFTFKDTPVSVGEVVCAAHFRGELKAVLDRVSLAAACAEEAERRELEPDEDAIDAAIEGFRFENDLISAEETERWLEVRGLTSDDLQGHFTYGHWVQTLGDTVTAVGGRLDETAELLGQAAIDLLISGGFGPLAVGLSRRWIARDQAEAPPGQEAVEAERRRFLKRGRLKAAGVRAWLAALGREDGWLEAMLALEAAYRQRCALVLTPDRLARSLAAARLPLTRIEIERVDFDSSDAAREAHLCVREDGLTLEEVARESRYPFERVALLAEDLPDEERQRLLCAPIGTVQEPAQSGEVFRLDRVTRKIDPDLADAPVRERLERKILDTHFAESGSRDVRWVLK